MHKFHGLLRRKTWKRTKVFFGMKFKYQVNYRVVRDGLLPRYSEGNGPEKLLYPKSRISSSSNCSISFGMSPKKVLLRKMLHCLKWLQGLLKNSVFIYLS